MAYTIHCSQTTCHGNNNIDSILGMKLAIPANFTVFAVGYLENSPLYVNYFKTQH